MKNPKKVCENCKSTYTSQRCEKCRTITAVEEVDAKFKSMCEEHRFHKIDLINIKKISGK